MVAYNRFYWSGIHGMHVSQRELLATHRGDEATDITSEHYDREGCLQNGTIRLRVIIRSSDNRVTVLAVLYSFNSI